MKTVIRCGELFTATARSTQKGMDVIIEDGKIAAVAPASADLPGDAEFIDLSDKFVAPGFIDMHTHVVMDGQIDPFDEMLYTSHGKSTIDGIFRAQRDLLAGFTTIRDCGGCRTGDAIAIRDAINSGLVDGPRMLVSGPYLVTSSVQTLYADGGFTFDGPDMARKYARMVVTSGADQIKFIGIGQVSLAELQALKEVAQDTGKLSSFHATDAVTIRKAALAAPDTIEHGLMLDEESVQIMIKNNVALIPTYCPYYFSVEHADEVYTPDVAELRRRNYEAHAARLPSLIKAGLTIGFGADTGATLTKHGAQAFEMELMNRNGMPAMDILLTATAVNSRLLRMQDRIGSIEPGKFADVVAFDRSPLEDIRATQDCAFVMKGGKVYKGAKAEKLSPAL